MTDKERLELSNLRKRLTKQREEIKRLQAALEARKCEMCCNCIFSKRVNPDDPFSDIICINGVNMANGELGKLLPGNFGCRLFAAKEDKSE